MEVNLVVPKGTDVGVILKQYPDLYEDEDYDDEEQSYWCGSSMQESDGDDEWMTHDECVAFCGFCEGAISTASTLIEGNGGWAQGLISCRDFSRLAVSEEQKDIWMQTSDIYWAAHRCGTSLSQTEVQKVTSDN